MFAGTVRWDKLFGLVHNVCWNCSMGQANLACTYCWLVTVRWGKLIGLVHCVGWLLLDRAS